MQICWLFLALCLCANAVAQNATTPGATSAPFPTINNVALEWTITGDTDLDGVVNIRYRAQGESTWRAALPLRRIPAGSNQGFSWANRHSGSVFDLMPDSTYEFELNLVDPDGGTETRLLTARTRAIPHEAAGALVRVATPTTLSSVINAAQPGDIVELSAGNYAGFTIDRNGSPDLPLTLRGLNGAVIHGEVGLFFRSHVLLRNLHVNGRIRFNGSNHISIIGCTVNAQTTVGAGDGIVSLLRAENSYIADNVVNGTTIWRESALGASGDNLGEGILVTGPGHVIRGNTVSNFRDAISLLEDTPGSDQYSIDIADNRIDAAADDGIEADFCAHNCRILRNQLTNTFIAMSSQPSLGGPVYFIRNHAYNVLHIPFKLYRTSEGDVILHNTIVKSGDGINAYPGTPIRRALFRNNIFLGGAASTLNGFANGSGRIIDLQTLETANSSMNFNGYGSALGTFVGRMGTVNFNSLAQLRSLTSESNAQALDFAVFEQNIAFPTPGNPLTLYPAQDLQLRANSLALDTGEPLANINDGFQGIAPDLGAFERVSDATLFRNGFE